VHIIQGLVGVVAVVGEDCIVRVHGSEGWGEQFPPYGSTGSIVGRVGWPLGAFGAFGTKGLGANFGRGESSVALWWFPGKPGSSFSTFSIIFRSLSR